MRKKSARVFESLVTYHFGAFDDIYSVFIVLRIYIFDVASTFFTDFYQLLLLRVAVSPIGELRSIVIVVLCCVSKCGSLNFYLKWGQL